MKKHLFLLFTFIQIVGICQETVSTGYARWEWGSDGYSIKSFRVDLQNNTPYVVTQIRMKLWIYNDEDQYYEHNKVQTFKVEIPAFELGKTPVIALSNRNILRSWKSFEGLSWGSEILDVKLYKTPAQVEEERIENERIRIEEDRMLREKEEEERLVAKKIALEKKINETLIIANDFYNKNKLLEAKKYFMEVLGLNPSQQEAKKKSNEILDFFSLRSGVGYLYRKEWSKEFSLMKLSISKLLNEESQKYKDGNLKMNVAILFDTTGTNLSTITGIESNELRAKLENLLQSSLTSPKKLSYFVNAHDQLAIEMHWKTESEMVISNGMGINGSGKNFTMNPNEMTEFIKKQPYKYGNFTFDVKNKTLQIENTPIILQDTYLSHYKLNAGPQYAFCSLVLPGWGAGKVSSGEKGTLTGLSYLLSLSLAAVFKGLEKIDYANYEQADSQLDAETDYEDANSNRKLFLVSLGIVGLTYVYDFTWSLVKGFGNIKKSSVYRNELKKGPVIVTLANI